MQLKFKIFENHIEKSRTPDYAGSSHWILILFSILCFFNRERLCMF